MNILGKEKDEPEAAKEVEVEGETTTENGQERVIYVCNDAPSLRFKIDGKPYQFEDKKFECDPEFAEKMDLALAQNYGLSQMIRKIDVQAALAIAQEHRQRMINLGMAAKGPMSTQDMGVKAAKINMEMRDAKLAREGTPQEVSNMTHELMEKHDLALTEKVHLPVAPPDVPPIAAEKVHTSKDK